MNKLFFSILITFIFCVSISQAVTVVNSRYSSSLSPGDRDTFTMTMKPDIPSEQGLLLTTGMDTGNCSGWVSLDKQGVKLVSAGTPVKASISVPSDATNGLHRCYAQFTGPQVGMVSSQIAVPFSITVKGGKDAPKIPAPAISTPTTSIAKATVTIEARAPVQEPIPLSLKSDEVEPTGKPAPSFPVYPVLIAVLIGVFGVVMIYDYRRGRR